MKQRAFQLHRDRCAALHEIVDKLVQEGKVELRVSEWCSPAFPVPKKKKGSWRLVIDYRKLNDATVVDGHPLPRIEDILLRQGKYKICPL